MERRYEERYLWSVMEVVTECVMKKNQPSQNVALSECQGKVVLDSVMESNTCATSWKIVTEIKISLASRKRCHGRRHGNSEVSSIMETVTGTAGVKESLLGQRRHGK